jgi:hypothetical protein
VAETEKEPERVEAGVTVKSQAWAAARGVMDAKAAMARSWRVFMGVFLGWRTGPDGTMGTGTGEV